MRDGFFLLLFSRPRPCQRHDPALIPPPSAGTHAVAWRMHALVAQGTEHRIRVSPVRIGSGALRGRRPVAGRPVRNGKVAGSNPAGSTTCGMPPRVSADIPRNDVTSRRRAPAMGYADSGLLPAARETAGPAGPSAGRPVRMWCSGSTPASQAGDRGFEPRHPLYPENQNNGSDPTMGLAAVLSMWTLPEKHGRTAPAWARSVKE